MFYDFDLITILCGSLEAKLIAQGSDTLEIDFGQDIVLCFINAPNDQDSLMGFKGTPWHVHGNIAFSGTAGNWIELSYGDALLGLGDGSVLVCERWVDRQLYDRWLIHAKYADEFRYMVSGDEIRVKRIAIRA